MSFHGQTKTKLENNKSNKHGCKYYNLCVYKRWADKQFKEIEISECWATKEREQCGCQGDVTQCTKSSPVSRKESALEKIYHIIFNGDQLDFDSEYLLEDLLIYMHKKHLLEDFFKNNKSCKEFYNQYENLSDDDRDDNLPDFCK